MRARQGSWVMAAFLLWAAGCSKDEPVATDATPPAAVTDLTVVAAYAQSVRLAWTAPGDDGAEGTAQSYDVRYSLAPITSSNWDAARQATGEPAPRAASSPESLTVTGLTPTTHYYFALVTTDDGPNPSGLSNVPDATTKRLLRRLIVDPANPEAYHSIGGAMEDAVDDDTVYVAAGTYTEALKLRGRRLVLIGQNAASTIVRYESQTEPDTVLSVSGGASLEVHTLRFVQPYIECGAGVFVEESRLLMTDCVLARCALRAVACDSVTLRRCTAWRIPTMQPACSVVPVIGLVGGQTRLEQNIIGGGNWGVSCTGGAQVTFACNDFYFNRVANFQGCTDPTGQNGNISADPRFVNWNEDVEDFHLRGDSPCRAGEVPGCGRMGAFD